MQLLTPPTHKPLSEDEARQAEASSVTLQRLLGKDEQPLQKATLRVSIEQPGGEKAERHRGLDELVAEAQKLRMY